MTSLVATSSELVLRAEEVPHGAQVRQWTDRNGERIENGRLFERVADGMVPVNWDDFGAAEQLIARFPISIISAAIKFVPVNVYSPADAPVGKWFFAFCGGKPWVSHQYIFSTKPGQFTDATDVNDLVSEFPDGVVLVQYTPGRK